MNFFNLDSPFMRFLTKMADLIILNILYMICCIPIVTIGAASTALYTVSMKAVKNEESYIIRGYFKAFKENFKISMTATNERAKSVAFTDPYASGGIIGLCKSDHVLPS